MKSLTDAIQSAFNASPAVNTLFANGLEWDVAADAEALPVCVATAMPPAEGVYQNADSLSPWLETIIVQISTYSEDPTFVQSMTGLLDALYHRQAMVLAAPDNLQMCRRTGGGNPYRDSDDARVWRSDLTYRFIVQHGV